jgi:hypothetical protein
MRWLRRLVRALALIVIVAVVAAVGVIVGIEYGCRPSAVAASASAAAPAIAVKLPGYRRDEAATFFTFPEWYIVYAAEDLGSSLATGDASGFNWFTAVVGYWRSVCSVRQAARAPPTPEVGAMIYAGGVAFSLEYVARGVYETTIGRLTEWWRGNVPTAEDRFAHQVAQDVAKFLQRNPWYRYPYWTRLGQLWDEVPLNGPARLRKWERRLALSLEYGVKAGAGALLQTGLYIGGDEGARDVMFVVRDLRPEDLAAEPRLVRLADLGGGHTLVRAPRSRELTEIALALARAGRVIPEVAGNRTMMMTVVAPEGASLPLPEAVSMPLAARPGFRRVACVVRIDELVEVVRALDGAGVQVEHLFDY